MMQRVEESMGKRFGGIALWILCLVTLHGAFLSSRAQERGPSTEDERARCVRLTRQLEKDPLGKPAKQTRELLTKWLFQVPDIEVKYCPRLLGPVSASEENYGSEITMQMMFSSAAFIIENPDRAKDHFSVYTAGVKGALKAYEALLEAKPEVQRAFLDDLLDKRDAGKLDAYIKEAMRSCK